MNKKKLFELINKKNERKSALVKQSEACEDVAQLRAISAEMDTLNEEIRSLQELHDSLPDDGDPVGRTAAVTAQVPGMVISGASSQEKRRTEDDVEKRVADIATELRAGREVTITGDVQSYIEQRAIATTNVMLENKYKRQVADNFNEVAQTVDLVDSFSLDGGKAYDVAFQITDGDADYSAEGATYTNSEGTFGTASTGYAKITNSAIISEEVVDLPNADYLTRVVNSVRKSIRKKMSAQIISGTGAANTIKGIYNAPTTTIPATYKVEISAIDENTLRTIVFAYGGSEDVERPATLFLNKLDLAAFAAIKATDGRPYYAITYNGASGTISEVGGGLSVPYTINSACNPLSATATTASTKTMVYGAPTAFELPMFTPLTIKRSDERYIDKGQVGFFGKIHVGGVVNSYKAFLPVVKVAAGG